MLKFQKSIIATFMVCHSTTAFIAPSRNAHLPAHINHHTSYSRSRALSSTPQQEETQSEMQLLGTQMILAAAKEAGATEPMITIDWKADKIKVTIDVNADETYVDDFDDVEEEYEEVLYDFEAGDDLILDEEELASMNFDDFDDEEFDEEFNEDEFEPVNRVDVTRVARTINEYLSRDGEGSLGDKIAQLHEIEVTTPEFNNELRGDRMFQVYKGFDVIVEHYEEKKKKKGANAEDDDAPKKLVKTEGKLVGRDTEKNRTTINVKGRNKNIKNELILSVQLPKAKREKGAK